MNKIIKWWKRKHFDLRKACVDKYSEEFGEMYDKTCKGESIGGFLETSIFLDMVERVKKESSLY
jgi:hypothetical protein